MTSKPNTPQTNRRNTITINDNEMMTSSRIPLPSPGTFRRSVSLRLRGSKGSLNNLIPTLPADRFHIVGDSKNSLAKSFPNVRNSPPRNFNEDTTSTTDTGGEANNFCTGFSRKRELNSSRSLSVITAEQNFLNDKEPPILEGGSNKIIPKENNCNSYDGKDLDKSSPGKRDLRGMSLNLNGPTVSNNSVSAIVRTPKSPHTPKTGVGNLSTRQNSSHHYLDDDLDSLYSYSSATSGRSTMSCEHPYVARNGTTFSGRKMKYVVHCSSYAGQVGEDYLTPTQRAQRQLRRLKELLSQARHDLEQKDSEILRLTREVVELRLFKASLSSPEDRSNSSDAVTVREATTELKTSQDVSPIVDMTLNDLNDLKSGSPRHALHHHGIHQVQFIEKMSNSEMQSSFADSGHFEDLTTSSVHSKDSYIQTQDRACGSDNNSSCSIDEQQLIRMYETRIEELVRTQDTATSEIKRSHNDKVEALLQKLAECNTRYADMVPDYEQAKERIRELEKQLEDLQRKLQEQDDKQKKMYLHMYTKGQEAERMSHADQVLEFAHKAPSRVSVPELLQQLQTTQDELENIRASNCRSESGSSQVLLTAKEAISLWVLGARKTIYRRLMEAQQNKTKVDPEVTLQFLKSAIYYFLTDKENSQGHLNAIESILEFSDLEKYNISKARSSK